MNNYNVYYTSRLISNIGDSLQEVAIIIIIASYINSVEITGIIVGMTAIIKILCSISVLTTSNKMNVKFILIFLNILYGVTTLFFYLYFINNDKITFWIVIIYELFCSFIYTFYKIYQEVLVKEVCLNNKEIAKLFTLDNIINVVIIFLGSTIILYVNSSLFLLLNAISFFVSASLIKFLKINNKKTIESLYTEKKNLGKIFDRIKNFKKKYKEVYNVLLFMTIISFSYVTFSMFLQYSLKKFEIKGAYIGYITGIFYLFTIIFSYIVGYIETNHIKKYILFFLKLIIIGFFILLLVIKSRVFVIIIPLIYSIYSGAINTLCQIFFQNNLSKEDIPIMKGVYNILCGISIILSGFITPFIILKMNISIFIILMIFINISSIFLLTRGEKNDI